MAMRRRSDTTELDLTDDDVNQMAESTAQKYLGISRAQFVAQVKRGEIPEHPIVGHLLLLISARSAR